MAQSLQQTTPATSLDDVYKTLSTEPLLEHDEFKAFYVREINNVRGGDKMARLELGLNRSFQASFYKAFLMGHRGVGKSTELTRLTYETKAKFRAIRFSAVSDLDASGFRPFDVLLVMMMRLVEGTAESKDKGGAGTPPPESLLRDIWNWFATETRTTSQSGHGGIEVSAGAGLSTGKLLTGLFDMFVKSKGEIKYTSDRKREVVDYRLSRLPDLVELLNRLLGECNRIMRDETGCEWLFIGEDFDKGGIPVGQTENLFIGYSNIFKDLQTHLIFTIPISLVYSEKAPQLPFDPYCIPDTPVFHQDHKPHKGGREALQEVLAARIDPDLFEKGQMSRLIVASGGNLRDLFSLVGQAADNAILGKTASGKIGRTDADAAIVNLRTEYERRLGESPYDEEKTNIVTYEKKAERLVRIYNADETAKIPDPILYSLLRARAVQEFNGQRWFGVHPMVVDILHTQGRISSPDEKKVPGGTE